jgi:HAD superfamily hydrolase (TIGR01484 family)
MHYRHFFFDMDKTIAPARQPLRPHMRELLAQFPHTVTIVSGSTVPNIGFQTGNLQAFYLGVNGNHAHDRSGDTLWQNPPLTERHKEEIHTHIQAIIDVLEHELNHEWHPIEDRGAQITFSPLGNTAPPELKYAYDPDRQKRLRWLEEFPFTSDDIVVRIGGTTSIDYFHKDGHKGANVKRLIETMAWDPAACVYFGDGLCPGGNDETVIGVIDTILVQDEEDTYQKLTKLLGEEAGEVLRDVMPANFRP